MALKRQLGQLMQDQGELPKRDPPMPFGFVPIKTVLEKIEAFILNIQGRITNLVRDS